MSDSPTTPSTPSTPDTPAAANYVRDLGPPATEDEIQRAMRRIFEGRTTLLITHRLSQIRWADRIVLLWRGEIAAQGSHDELMESSELYRRIFSHNV